MEQRCRLLLTVNEHDLADTAFVDMLVGDVEDILHFLFLVKRLRASELRFPTVANYFYMDDLENYVDAGLQGEFVRMRDDLAKRSYTRVVYAGFRLPESMPQVLLSTSELVLYDNEVHWAALAAHDPTPLETEMLRRETIEELFQQLVVGDD